MIRLITTAPKQNGVTGSLLSPGSRGRGTRYRKDAIVVVGQLKVRVKVHDFTLIVVDLLFLFFILDVEVVDLSVYFEKSVGDMGEAIFLQLSDGEFCVEVQAVLGK